MPSTKINNYQDVIDSREVIDRIEELESDLQDGYDGQHEEAQGLWENWLNDPDTDAADEPPKPPEFEDWVSAAAGDTGGDLYAEALEYTALKALADEADGCGDWKYGAMLVRESYFEAYARELAEEIGAVNPNANWPNNCIDWERAARELQMDYTSVDFDGVAYLIRS